MQHSIEDCLDKLEDSLPTFLSPHDLVTLGIAGSHSGLGAERKNGQGIPFIKIGPRRIRYPRDSVLTFLRENAALSQKSSTDITKKLDGGILDDHHKN